MKTSQGDYCQALADESKRLGRRLTQPEMEAIAQARSENRSPEDKAMRAIFDALGNSGVPTAAAGYLAQYIDGLHKRVAALEEKIGETK